MSNQVLDVRGLSCPEPVIRLQQALKELGDKSFSVITSSPTAKNNMIAYLEDTGRSFTVKNENDDYIIDVK